MPVPIGSFGFSSDGGAVLALRDGFYRFDLATASVTPLARLPVDHPDIRLNDGKVDRQGRFVAGSIT